MSCVNQTVKIITVYASAGRPLQRQWSSSFKESLEAEEAHAQGTMVTWRRIVSFS